MPSPSSRSLRWGFAIVADSPQFSASIAELSERSLVGTMLTMQTCLGSLLTLVTIDGLAGRDCRLDVGLRRPRAGPTHRLDRHRPAACTSGRGIRTGTPACRAPRARREGAGQRASERPIVETAGEHRWPDTLDVMGWSVDPTGFGVVFDRAIPPFVEANAGAPLDRFLDGAGIDRRDVARFLFRPGGIKVIAALERALGLAEGALDHERRVLAEPGNMSALTALFVLEHVLAACASRRVVLTARGPGFTASFVSLAPGHRPRSGT